MRIEPPPGPAPGAVAGRVPHVPVLIGAIVAACAPIRGRWLDGTFGAGGYARALLDAGAAHVTGIDRDPRALALAAPWAGGYGDRLTLREGLFSTLDTVAEGPLDGVVLDLGVSSMQVDEPARGFSFAKDGPLDMRMGGGISAADLIATASEAELADILYHYGEERASRRIARAIVRARDDAPIETTLRLAEVVSACLPRLKPGQIHPATRSFQAIRIAVNAELGELAEGLAAAERALAPDGALAVVTFHSLEDRIVKRFLQTRSGHDANANRYAPETPAEVPRFTLPQRRAIAPDAAEVAANPRARSARLRVARRTDAPSEGVATASTDWRALGLPALALPALARSDRTSSRKPV